MKIKAINKGSEAKALAFQEFLGFSDKDEVFIVNLEDGKRTPLFNSYIDRTDYEIGRASCRERV